MKKTPMTARQALEAARAKPSRQTLPHGQASVEVQMAAAWAAQQQALEATRAEQAQALEMQRAGQREALAAARMAEAAAEEEQRAALEAMRAQQQRALEETRAALEVQRVEQELTLQGVRREQQQALDAVRAEKAQALEATRAEQRRALEAQRAGQRRALEETRAEQDQALLRMRMGGSTSPMRYSTGTELLLPLPLAAAVQHDAAVQRVDDEQAPLQGRAPAKQHQPPAGSRRQPAASLAAAKGMTPAKTAPPAKAAPALNPGGGKAVTAAEAAARASRFEAKPKVTRGQLEGRGAGAAVTQAEATATQVAQLHAEHAEEMQRRHVTFQTSRADCLRALGGQFQQAEGLLQGRLDRQQQQLPPLLHGFRRPLSGGEQPMHVAFQQQLAQGSSQPNGARQAEGSPAQLDGQQLQQQQQQATGLRALWLRGQLAGLRRSVLDLQQERLGYEQAVVRRRSQ